jgi:hypothetical protein
MLGSGQLPGTKVVVIAAVLLTLALAGIALAVPAPARASAGCDGLNDPFFDQYYGSAEFNAGFAAGEQLTMTAGEPSSGSPTQVTLSVNSVLVDSPYPGTAQYTIPASGTYNVGWGVGPSKDASWSVSCALDATAPSVTINQAASQADPTSSSPINFTAVFGEPVTGFGVHASDVTLSGTAGASTAVVTQSARFWRPSSRSMTRSMPGAPGRISARRVIRSERVGNRHTLMHWLPLRSVP